MKMKLNRDHLHVSLTGLSVLFKADVPTFVPPRLVKEVIALGGVAADEDKAAEAIALAEIDRAKVEMDARRPAIVAAVEKMLERNQRGDFTAGARPNINVLNKETGLMVTTQELEPIWNEVKNRVPA